MIIPLTTRLEKAASLVGRSISSQDTQNTVVADVGCDHAYLSLHLITSGKCQKAIASDLREGPLRSAAENIKRYGCEDRITTVLTNGLDGIGEYHPSDILICGMGGDTIIQILQKADFIKQKGMRLILQPQTAFAELALYLADEGFRIHTERYARDKSKAYRIIAAEYTGDEYDLSVYDALIGHPAFEEDRESFCFYCQKMLSKIDKKIVGARNHNDNTSSLISLRNEILHSIES